MIYANGNQYEGNWNKGLRNGVGTYTYANGDIFSGKWESGRKNGKGTINYVNGDKYDGDWNNNKIQGLGVFTYSDGSSYDGEWLNSKRNGRGTFITASNEKYLGEWLNDLKEGEGTYTYGDGSKYKGKWKNNKFQYTDNAALSFSNSGLDTVYNNYFNHIDYSGVGYSFTILTNTKTGPITFSRNTIDTAGASAGLNTPGSIETDKNDFFKYCKMANGQTATNPTTMAFEEFTGECSQRPIAEYNYFTNMGLVQHDGAALQASSLVQRGTVYAYNWVMNTRKLGLRFDSGDDCIYGDNGTMHHNVVYGALGGIKSKGNDHIFYNNLVFESWQSEDLQILRYYPADQSCQPIGDRSVVVNNAGGTITGLATGNLDITSYAKYNAQYNYNEFVNQAKDIVPFLYNSYNINLHVRAIS